MKLPALLLFSCMIASSFQVQALEVFSGGEHKSTVDLFYRDAWKKKNLEVGDKKIAGNFFIAAGASVNQFDTDFEISQKVQGYFYGHGNMVYVAAKDSSIRIPKANGDYDLSGKYYFLHSTQFVAKKDLYFTEKLKIRLEPHIFSIHDYHYGDSTLNLNVKNGTALLTGNLYRLGTRRFGFLRNEKEDKGWGWGMHLEADYEFGPLSFHARVENLLSQLRFSSIHFSDRQYNAQYKSGDITGTGNTLALRGRYNHKTSNERLPVYTTVNVRHNALDGFSLGFYSLGNVITPVIGYETYYRNFVTSVSSMQFKNLMLNLVWNPEGKLQAGIGVHYTKESSVQFASMFARYTW